MEKNESRAIELWSEAADLGSTEALHNMGDIYYHGKGVKRDKSKGLRCWESAAMQGGVHSRHCLGCIEYTQHCEFDRAVRHFLISAKMGLKPSLDIIRRMLVDGTATKAQYAEALKGYQAAMEETKSPDRELEKGNLLEQWRRIVEGRDR